MSRLIVALDWDGKYLKAANLQQVGLNDTEIIGGNIQTYLDPDEWAEMTAALKKGRSLKRLQTYNTPIGTTEQLVHWEKSGSGKRQMLVGTVDQLKLIKPAIVTQITDATDESTDRNMKIGQNGIIFSVPDSMDFNHSLRTAVQAAFKKFPLQPHREILDESTIIIDEKIKIYCPIKEQAVALSEGRWDLADYAYQPYLPDQFAIYYLGDDRSSYVLHSQFSTEDAALGKRLQLKEIRDMMRQIPIGDNGVIVSPALDFRALCTTVLHSPGLITLVDEATSKPLVVSGAYADWTNRSQIDWVGDAEGNKARWGAGEMERMQAALERDGLLTEFEYTAYFFGNPEPQTWYTTFQRLQVDGHWLRIGKVLKVQAKNLVMV